MFLSECLMIPHSKTFLVTCMIWQNSWCDHSYNAPSFNIIRTRGVSWIEQLYPSTVLCSLNSESPLEQELLGLSLASESPITFWVKVVPHWQGNQLALCGNGLDRTNELFTKKGVMRGWGNIQSHPWRKFSNPKMRLYPRYFDTNNSQHLLSGGSVTLSHSLFPVLIAYLGKLRLREALRASQWE